HRSVDRCRRLRHLHVARRQDRSLPPVLRHRADPLGDGATTPVTRDAPRYDFYRDLASWWPLISPVEDYVEEAAYVAGLLRDAPHPVRTVLELGSGGGHNAVHL